jgi:hypothetical protein
MAIVTSEQSIANEEYLRRLLRQRQPGFSAALERAVDLLGQELDAAEMSRDIGASQGPCPAASRCCHTRPLPRRPLGRMARRQGRSSAGHLDPAPSTYVIGSYEEAGRGRVIHPTGPSTLIQTEHHG